jgi:hypothetical protein
MLLVLRFTPQDGQQLGPYATNLREFVFINSSIFVAIKIFPNRAHCLLNDKVWD